MYQYFNELLLGEVIESAYLKWNSEQHRLKPKYDIKPSLAPLVKHYIVTMEENDTIFKITCQFCNGFVAYKCGIGELLYINFLLSILCTLELYPEDLDPDFFNFQWPAVYHVSLK